MKLFKKIYAILMTFMFVLCVVGFANEVGATTESSVTILAKKGSGDGSEITTSKALTDLFSSGADSFTSISASTKSYCGGSNGVKMATSSVTGSLTLAFNSNLAAANISTIVVSAKRYSSSKAATLNVNSKGTQSLTADFADYTYTIGGKASSLELEASKYCWIESIKINYTLEEVPLTGISLNETEKTLTAGDSFNLSATLTPINTTQISLDWASTNESVATVSNGVVTAVAAGTTTITATSTANPSLSASCTITVEEYEYHAGTVEDPFNVEDSIRKIDENEGELTDGSYYVKGIISEAPTLNYGMLTFYIKDDLTDTNKLQCYNIAKSDGTYTQDDCDSLKVGYEVVVYGKMKKYYSTYEIDGSAGANLDSVTYPQYSATYHYNNGDADQVVQSSASTGKFIEPEDPEKDGSTFYGWYIDEDYQNLYDFSLYASENIDLYAQFKTTFAGQNDLDAVDSYMTMAFTYDFVNNGFILADSVDDITDGCEILIVGTLDGNTYAMNSTSPKSRQLGKNEVNVSDGKISSVDNGCIWEVEKNGTEFYISNAGKYIKLGDLGVTSTKTPLAISSISGKAGLFIYSSSTPSKCILCRNEYDFREYSTSNIGASGYATRMDIYVRDASYSNVDFRLKVAVDDILSIIDDVDSYGISLTAGTTEIKLTGDKLHEDTDKLYSIVDLGDVINTNSRASTTFTVKAYVTVGDETYYSTSEKEYSVVDMVEVYYNMGGEVKTQVSGLYNYFASQGLYD